MLVFSATAIFWIGNGCCWEVQGIDENHRKLKAIILEVFIRFGCSIMHISSGHCVGRLQEYNIFQIYP